MIQYKYVLTPTVLFAAGSFVSAAQATTHLDVDYTASDDGTLIAIGVAPEAAQFSFQTIVNETYYGPKTEHHLYGNGGSGAFYEGQATPAYIPTSGNDFGSGVKTGTDGLPTIDGYYGIRFDIGDETQYGYFTVEDGGTHISAVDYDAAPPSDVPEPAIWAEMILGFGLAGAALRRHRQSALVATA